MSDTAELFDPEDGARFTKAFLKRLEPLTTPEEMRQWDADSVTLGVPGIVLMENAAQGARQVLQQYVPDLRGLSCALIMGAGNNGGDAACLSRMLLDLGAHPVVYGTKSPADAKGDAGFYTRTALQCGVPFRPAAEFDGRCDILIDGLLGTGFHGTLRQDTLDLIRLCNAESRLFTLGLDIPSGLSARTGLPCPEAVRCDATATFAASKPGLALPHARAYTGDVHVCYIGTPLKAKEKTPASFLRLDEECLTALPLLEEGGYKGSYGHVLVAGGARGLSGAAHVAALAALRAGAGLVTAAAPADAVDSVKGSRPEIMTMALAGQDGQWPGALPDSLKDLSLRRGTAIVAGPGLGRGEDAEAFLDALLSLPRSRGMVLDADALYLLARHPEWSGRLTEDDILTPHPGEARRLLGGSASVLEDRPAAARELAEKYRCVVILKGAGTLVAAPYTPILLYGEDIPQLSCGGSGDCLAGVAGALLGRLPVGASLACASLACVWHGTAGMLLAEKYPFRGNLAGEVADALTTALAHAIAGQED